MTSPVTAMRINARDRRAVSFALATGFRGTTMRRLVSARRKTLAELTQRQTQRRARLQQASARLSSEIAAITAGK